MRTAIGLIGLGLIGGVVPTGLQGGTYALQDINGYHAMLDELRALLIRMENMRTQLIRLDCASGDHHRRDREA